MRAAPLVITLMMLSAAPAGADEPDGPVPDVPATDVGPSANDWLRVGLERYERGNLVGAIEAFERGHAKEPRPMFLFALGQAHRKRGDCARARASFDAFLATAPPKAQADAALEQRERCTEAAPEPVVAAPAPTPPPAPPAIAAPPPAPRARPWYGDRVAVVSGAATVALVGGSAALWLSARQSADAAAAAGTYDQHRALRERAEARQLHAGIALGAAALTTGVTVWRLTRDRTEPRPQPPRASIAPVVAPGTVGVALGGHF